MPVHRPRAVVIGCSDARVPVERVFDQALLPIVAPITGRLACVATAGLSEDEVIRTNALAAMSEVRAFLRRTTPEIAAQVMVCGAVKALDTGRISWLE